MDGAKMPYQLSHTMIFLLYAEEYHDGFEYNKKAGPLLVLPGTQAVKSGLIFLFPVLISPDESISLEHT